MGNNIPLLLFCRANKSSLFSTFMRQRVNTSTVRGAYSQGSYGRNSINQQANILWMSLLCIFHVACGHGTSKNPTIFLCMSHWRMTHCHFPDVILKKKNQVPCF